MQDTKQIKNEENRDLKVGEDLKNLSLPPRPVTHLAQCHGVEGFTKKDKDELELVAISQFRIIKYIENHRNVLVVSEDIVGTFDKEAYDMLEKASILYPDLETGYTTSRKVFKDGFPDDVSGLTTEQKEYLVDNGAARTLYCLGKLNNIYGAYTQEENKQIQKKLAPFYEKYGNPLRIDIDEDKELVKILHNEREACVKRSVDRIINDKKADKESFEIVIIFGAGHDFSDEFVEKSSYIFHKNEDTDPRDPIRKARDNRID